MADLDGNSTSVVKNGLESILYYALAAIEDVGKVVVEAPNSGTYTEDDEYDLPATGEDLVARCTSKINPDTNLNVTVIGTDQDDAALTGTFTIEKGVAAGQSYSVTPGTTGKRFKTVSSVFGTGGALGDGFTLNVLPKTFTEVCFIEGFDLNEGTTTRPIFKRYDVDHNKRTRGDKRITVNAKYTNHLEGLARIKDRDVTLKVAIHDDGGDLATELFYIDTVRLSTPISVPEEDDATIRGEGNYGRYFVFS